MKQPLNHANHFAMPLMALALALAFLACEEKKDSEKKDVSAVTETGNALHISDSIKVGKSNAMYYFEAKIPFFDSITDASLLKSMYDTAKIATNDYSKNGLKKALLELKEQYLSNYKENEDWNEYSGSGMYDNFDMEVRSITGNFLTISYKHEGFWGGAHGGLSYKVSIFDLKNNKPVLLNDIIKNPADNAWGKIVKANFLAQEEERAHCVWADTIAPSDNFYFDSTGITFNYDQYEIADYSCGAFAIHIPFDKRTENLLTPDFAKLASQNPNICDVPYRRIQLKSAEEKNTFSLTLALCDENMENGYVVYNGKTERMSIRLGKAGVYNEIYRGEINGQYVLNMQGNTIKKAYYILKKNNKRTDLEVEYKAVKIGSQTWMAENLNYAVEGSKCYENKEENCEKYGRLYGWETAKVACPNGWHLPDTSEWNILMVAIGGVMSIKNNDDEAYLYNDVGTKLKSKTGWSESGNGTDEFGFSAVPSGYSNENFNNVGYESYWWSATEYGEGKARYLSMLNDDYVFAYYMNKSEGISVRCVKD